MPDTARVKRVSPMLLTDDMERTLLFYEEVLGFTLFLRSSEYAIVERDGVLIHFKTAWSEAVMDYARGHTEIYIEVTGIHDLWNHVKTFKDRYLMRDLFDREYGMTEFHVRDPNDCLVFVGEAIEH